MVKCGMCGWWAMSDFTVRVNMEHNRVHSATSLYRKCGQLIFEFPQVSTAVRLPEAVELEQHTCTHTHTVRLHDYTHPPCSVLRFSSSEADTTCPLIPNIAE